MLDTEFQSMVVDCSDTVFIENQSWALGRLLRDDKTKFQFDLRSLEVRGRAESVRINIFNLEPPSVPKFNFVWWPGMDENDGIDQDYYCTLGGIW